MQDEAPMSMTSPWFEMLFGFHEGSYEETRSRFSLEGDMLRSAVNGRAFSVGTFTTPTLASLRTASRGMRPGRPVVTHETIGDVLELHALAENEHALFQVASQLNCLEFAGPDELPEQGVTQYASDPTQGPACSLAAGAATVFRNYFVEIGGERGQTASRQIDNLAGVVRALGEPVVDVRNGYTFSDSERLALAARLVARGDRDALMGELAIGLQTGVDVTFSRRWVEPDAPRRVSQAFCSALSCGYASGTLAEWEPLATLVLDGAYEATLLAAIASGCERVWLTFLGGGAFGNDPSWIGAAMARALERVSGHAIDVRIVHFRRRNEAIVAAVERA
jgi:hypothetical protein